MNDKLLQLRKEEKIYLQGGDTGKASAPSNIALLKYWGKEGGQVPHNPSVSFTLNHFYSTTTITVLNRFAETMPRERIFSHEIILNGKAREDKKLENFLNVICEDWAPEISFKVESVNNFPTACGIASSASGYAALVLALADLLQLEKHLSAEDLHAWLSFWARMGSGSAVRSVLKGDFIAWETNNKVYKVESHALWKNLKHCVIAVDENEKAISSSAGHKFANSSPLHQIRVQYAHKNFSRLKNAVTTGDFETVARLSEDDALKMHSVMLSSQPSLCYFKEETISIISEFISWRTDEKIFWTLDAGPNVHFLYLNEETIKSFLRVLENKKIAYKLLVGTK